MSKQVQEQIENRAEHAALVWVVERCGGVVDLLTADVEWMPAQVVTVREEVAA